MYGYLFEKKNSIWYVWLHLGQILKKNSIWAFIKNQITWWCWKIENLFFILGKIVFFGTLLEIIEQWPKFGVQHATETRNMLCLFFWPWKIPSLFFHTLYLTPPVLHLRHFSKTISSKTNYDRNVNIMRHALVSGKILLCEIWKKIFCIFR